MKTSNSLAILFVVLSSAAQPVAAQTPETEARRLAIESFYPVMIEANNAGNFDKARSLCQQAIEWEPQKAVHHFNLACIEAKAGNSDAAFAALTQANHNGLADTEGLNSDADLASLRADPRFNDIMFQAARNAIDQKGAALNPTPTPTPRPAGPKPGFDPNRRLTPAPPERPTAPPLSSNAAAPAPAQLSASGPVGLYFMTRYWSATSSLEKATWYFSPDGMAYENPTGDFSTGSLEATASDQGKLKLEDGKIAFTPTKGKNAGMKELAGYEPKPEGGFYWNGGFFNPVQPLVSAGSIVGKWQGGISVSGAAVSRTLDLQADGNFKLSGTASISAESDGSVARAGSSGGILEGTWNLSGYFITLNGKGADTRRSIAFSYDDASTPRNPDKFYFDGIMWSPVK